MKKLILTILVILVFLTDTGAQFNLITYNIRLNTSGDGEHAWPYRQENVISLLKFHEADIFCVQEALPDQIRDLKEAFPEFRMEGVGRDDGKDQGEFSAVFFNAAKFKQSDGGTFWLSETPGECSYGWDAACRRICTWVKLQESATGKIFFVFNTHFDHKGEEARKHSAELIIHKTTDIAGPDPIILCGDFNLTPESEPIGILKEAFGDAFDISALPAYGSVPTFLGFTYDDSPLGRIDYVFVSEDVRVKRYGALTDSKDRSFFSDHLPVLVTVVIK